MKSFLTAVTVTSLLCMLGMFLWMQKHPYQQPVQRVVERVVEVPRVVEKVVEVPKVVESPKPRIRKTVHRRTDCNDECSWNTVHRQWLDDWEETEKWVRRMSEDYE